MDKVFEIHEVNMGDTGFMYRIYNTYTGEQIANPHTGKPLLLNGREKAEIVLLQLEAFARMCK